MTEVFLWVGEKLLPLVRWVRVRWCQKGHHSWQLVGVHGSDGFVERCRWCEACVCAHWEEI